MTFRLHHEQAIKRILVMQRQHFNVGQIVELNRQRRQVEIMNYR